MAFQKFGKFIFPVVATACSLDVLSSAFNDSYYDITEQISVDLTKEGFPDNVKNVCTSEIKRSLQKICYIAMNIWIILWTIH